MNAAIYSRSLENRKRDTEKVISTNKPKLGMNLRAPLSSINRNAQNNGNGPFSKISKKIVALRKEPVSTKRFDKSKPKRSLRPFHGDSCKEEETQGFLLEHVKNASIFRARNKVSGCESFETILQHANPIHERPKVLIHVDSREDESQTLELFDEHRVDMDVDGINLKHLIRISGENCTEKEVEKRKSRFLEDPNDDFFSEEMDRLLTLELANPINEIDSDVEDGDLS